MNSNLPSNAAALESSTSSRMKSAMGRLAAQEAALLFALAPGSPVTPDIVVANDTSAGAAPFSVTFAGTLDGGFNQPTQTRVSGKATYASDPSATPFASLSGQATIDATVLGIFKVYHAEVAYTVGATDRTVSGTGYAQDPTTGNRMSMNIDPAKPLRIAVATGTTANGCGYAIDGDVQLAVTGPQGSYGAKYRFTATKPTVTVDSATYTDADGMASALPPTEVDLRCNEAAATIDAWVGNYNQVWGCLPFEWGTGHFALTVKDATTVTINDEDPPGSGDGDIYEASIVGGSPRALRGFFIAGPVGSRYREDFNWTLAPDGKRFVQVSRYVYQEGPFTGSGGNCMAIGTRH